MRELRKKKRKEGEKARKREHDAGNRVKTSTDINKVCNVSSWIVVDQDTDN